MDLSQVQKNEKVKNMLESCLLTNYHKFRKCLAATILSSARLMAEEIAMPLTPISLSI